MSTPLFSAPPPIRQTLPLSFNQPLLQLQAPLFDPDIPTLYDTPEQHGEQFHDLVLYTSIKPWRKPDITVTDYFNYGFTERTYNLFAKRDTVLRTEFQNIKSHAEPSGPVSVPLSMLQGNHPPPSQTQSQPQPSHYSVNMNNPSQPQQLPPQQVMNLPHHQFGFAQGRPPMRQMPPQNQPQHYSQYPLQMQQNRTPAMAPYNLPPQHYQQNPQQAMHHQRQQMFTPQNQMIPQQHQPFPQQHTPQTKPDASFTTKDPRIDQNKKEDDKKKPQPQEPSRDRRDEKQRTSSKERSSRNDDRERRTIQFKIKSISLAHKCNHLSAKCVILEVFRHANSRNKPLLI
ncbi:putative pre-mRNA 3'-end-processing factor FIP1 [Blattamonas nauphoetae]|uniref:Pre-mRNA 3'-end-processing factor FIP1 n=1 Tax=Blattamonas nauphoetae TaxID=2049346 RepID=A0ABQ9XYI1_9EUKA|nr:putative pre-mRNA 3'-end-processing factor FIP1 [Blattamonas nauphoetae]